MAGKGLLKERIGKLKRDTAQAGREGLSGPAVVLAVECGIHFLLAAVLAGGVVFGDFAPLGVAMVAGAGSGLCGGAALLGATLGYLTLLGFADGLRYLSAAILTFSVAFAFSDVKGLRRPWAMPTVAAALNACAGYIYLSQDGWGTAEVIFFLGEIAITLMVAWSCRVLLLPGRSGRGEGDSLSRQRQTAAVVVGCALLVSLSAVTFLHNLSLGRVVAVVVVLCTAYAAGVGPGAALGVAAGLSLDLCGGGMPLYAMAFGTAAMAAGAMRGGRRVSAAVAYVLANGAAVLWTWELGLPLSILYEVFLGSVLFMLVPAAWIRRLTVATPPERGPRSGGGDVQRVRRKLEQTAAAFRTLGDCLRLSARPPQNDNDVANVFDRAAVQVCKRCSLRATCWERDYVTTFNALNDATGTMLDRGRGERSDFPRYFADRCLHFPAFLEAVNGELTGLLYRRQYNSRIRESRAAVCRQYGQLSNLLGDAAVELGRELVPDLGGLRKLRQHLAGLGLEPELTVQRDHRGLLRAELTGPGLELLTQEEEMRVLSALLKAPLRAELGENRLVLAQLEPLMAVAGVAARKKDGETVSGDAGTYFKGEDGSVYLLLCDGMGSGPEAHRESTLAVRLLEQFLRAGVGAEQALVTLSSALGLRGEETGGFTTVDLLKVDLFTGGAGVYKLGAAPTYVKKKGSVRRIAGTALPAGLGMEEPSAPDYTPLQLEPGDCVLMVSDGVAVGEDDDWLRQRLLEFDGASPKELARALITDGPEGATDDRTALVVKIEARCLREQ